MTKINKIDSISELHRILGCGKPKNPSVSIIKYADIDIPKEIYGQKFIFNFYVVSLKQKYGELKYGHHYYDFEEGTLIFTSPGQVITPLKPKTAEPQSGWALYFHPDLLRTSGLGDRMSNYSFFSYTTNEALHLSEDENQTIDDCILKIEKEYSQNIDKHTPGLIVSNIELLLNYCTRFYDRQFITRAPHNKDHIIQFDEFLFKYYNSDLQKKKGLPTVSQCAEAVNLSPHYLSDLLKKETGKNTQEHIHYFIIEQAKNKLLSSVDPISEIAYQLGFEYPAYFTKLFKSKTGISPLEFRSLN